MTEEQKTSGSPAIDPKAAEEMAKAYDEAGKTQTTSQLPKIDFSMFMFSLNSSVMVHLGILDDPATGKKSKNLPAAKQTLDLLTMLQEKTQGNLTSEEDGMLKHILYDLRMIYVRESC